MVEFKPPVLPETGLGSLEEHFRKSLGEDYSKLFQNTAKPAPKSDEEAGRKGRQEGATAGRKSRQEETTAEKQEEPKTKESDVVKTIRDDMDTGYTGTYVFAAYFFQEKIIKGVKSGVFLHRYIHAHKI